MENQSAKRSTLFRRAKIVGTIGPASSDVETLRRLIRSGLDVVRLNLSHGNHDSHREVIRTVRRLGNEERKFVPIIADLMGPRYRLATIADGPRKLDAGQKVTFGAGDVDLPVEDPDFLDHLQEDERILIDNGMLELKVLTKLQGRVEAEVLNGGLVSTRKGINLPDTDLPFTISDKDRADIAFAIEEKVDFIAVSFVGGPKDLHAVRAVMEEHDGLIPLIAKLERAKAMDRLVETVRASDAVMVARGDLGVEVPIHYVPVLQKKIINTGRRWGKPVIVATQMLESMMAQPRPTRAEASDVANAVFDGADALMLSGETAAGKYPVEAVVTMADTIKEAEKFRPPKALQHDSKSPEFLVPLQTEEPYLTSRDVHLEIPEMVTASAVHACNRLGAQQIVAFSQGGFTARMIARYRPSTAITVFSRNVEVARRVQLVWGAHPVLMKNPVSHHDEVVASVDRMLVEQELAQPGDTIVILMGDPIEERPLTNLMRVHRVRD